MAERRDRRDRDAAVTREFLDHRRRRHDDVAWFAGEKPVLERADRLEGCPYVHPRVGAKLDHDLRRHRLCGTRGEQAKLRALHLETSRVNVVSTTLSIGSLVGLGA